MEKAYYTSIEFTTQQKNGEWGKGGWAMTNYWTENFPKIITRYTCYGKTKEAAEDLLMNGLTCEGKREICLVDTLSKKEQTRMRIKKVFDKHLKSLDCLNNSVEHAMYLRLVDAAEELLEL